MKTGVSHRLMAVTALAGLQAAFGNMFVDLGPAGPANWDPHIGNDNAPYVADVSRDGALAGGTDRSRDPSGRPGACPGNRQWKGK